MIVDKLQAYLESITGVEIPEEVVERVAIQVARSTRRNFGDARNSDGNALRMSALGRCPRAGWYLQAKEKAEPLPARTRLTFMFGDTIEAQMIGLATLAGLPIRDTNREVTLRIAGRELKGHIDLVIENEGQLEPVEIKSMSRKGFEEAIKNGMPGNDFGYLDQLQAYMRGMNAKRGTFLCVSKEQGHMAEYTMGRADETYMPRAEAYVKGVLASTPPDRPYAPIDEVITVQGKVKAEEIAASRPDFKALDRRGAWYPFATGRKVLGKTCGYCSFHSVCFKGLVTEIEDGKPRWVIPAEKGV